MYCFMLVFIVYGSTVLKIIASEVSRAINEANAAEICTLKKLQDERIE